MSGGYFDYSEYHIGTIVDDIEKLVNGGTNVDEYYSKEYKNYSDETKQELKNALEILRKAEVYAHRIDWLLSGDDGEESFHKNLKEDLDNLSIRGV